MSVVSCLEAAERCVVPSGWFLEASLCGTWHRHNHGEVFSIPAQNPGFANTTNFFRQAEDVGYIADVDRFGLFCHRVPSFSAPIYLTIDNVAISVYDLPSMPRAERASRSGEGEQEDRLQATLQTLEAGIDSILSSDGFAAYLKTMAKLPHYSFGNVLLIHAQHPAPTMVAGYRRWQSLGRQVRKGERGIKILVPYTRKIAQDEDSDETPGDRMAVRGFGVGTVFDVSSTDGDPLPEPPRPEMVDGASDTGMRLYADLLDYLELHGVTTNREDTEPANGYYQPFNRHVGIGRHIDGDQATKTLTHETARFSNIGPPSARLTGDCGTMPGSTSRTSTLEPCTRRNPPKTPCAARLVDRGVGTVFIGMYEPDPRIYREGWRVLRDAGVELRDFDAALREEIKVDNSEFIGQFRHAVGIKGKARFDYTQNVGRFALYSDDRSVRFETRWTPAGSGCIYPIDSQFNVAQARYATEFSQIDDPSALDFDSYTYLLRVGQIGVFRNQEGYALIRVEKVLHPDYGDDRFELFFSYELRLRVPGDTLQ